MPMPHPLIQRMWFEWDDVDAVAKFPTAVLVIEVNAVLDPREIDSGELEDVVSAARATFSPHKHRIDRVRLVPMASRS